MLIETTAAEALLYGLAPLEVVAAPDRAFAEALLALLALLVALGLSGAV